MVVFQGLSEFFGRAEDKRAPAGNGLMEGRGRGKKKDRGRQGLEAPGPWGQHNQTWESGRETV